MSDEAPLTVITNPEVSEPNAKEFDESCVRAQKEFGHSHFTILRWIQERSALKRIYSTDPKVYPVGGEKQMRLNSPWIQTVIRSQQIHLCKSPQDIQGTYTDYQRLFDQGIGQVFCIPVISGKGETLGAFSISNKEGSYDDSTVEKMKSIVNDLGVSAMEDYIKRGKE